MSPPDSSTEIQPGGSSSSTDNDDSMVMPAMGTTSLAFLIKDGIILASYSHMSTESETSRIMGINPYTLCTKVGEPVDQLFWTQCELCKTQNKRVLPIELAAGLLEEMMNFYSREGLFAEALIAGWEGESPILYYVDKDDMGCVSGYRFAIGPGTPCVDYTFEVGYRYDMSFFEAVSLARWAMHLAALKVGAGNRGPSVYYGGFNGWEKILGDDVVEFPPSSGTMDIEDEETFKYWRAQLKEIEEREFMIDAFSVSGIQGSDLRGS